MAVAALSLPLTALGHDTLIIPLGAAARQCKNNSIGFADLETPWLKSFFEEHSLSENRMQKATGTLEVSREGPCVRVKLSLEISPTLECVRSLTHFEQHLNVHGNALFMIKKPLKPLRGTSGRKFTAATEDELDDDGIQLNESDLELYEFDSNNLIFDEFILDSLQLCIPDRPLCRPDCKGLCAQCGENLNDKGKCSKNPEQCPHFNTLI